MPAHQPSFALARCHVDFAQAAMSQTNPSCLPLLPRFTLGCISSCTQYLCSYLPHSLTERMLRVLQTEETSTAQFNHFLRDWQYSGDGCIVGFLHLLPQTLKIQLGQDLVHHQ